MLISFVFGRSLLLLPSVARVLPHPIIDAPMRRRPLLRNGAGKGDWNRSKPPSNGARQIARYSRQAACGQITRASGLVD